MVQNYPGAMVRVCIEQPAIWAIRLTRLADEVLKTSGEYEFGGPVFPDHIKALPQGSVESRRKKRCLTCDTRNDVRPFRLKGSKSPDRPLNAGFGPVEAANGARPAGGGPTDIHAKNRSAGRRQGCWRLILNQIGHSGRVSCSCGYGINDGDAVTCRRLAR